MNSNKGIKSNKISNQLKEFLSEYQEALKSDKNNKKVSNFSNLNAQLQNICNDICKRLNLSKEMCRASIGKGLIADSPWISFEDDSDFQLFSTIIFYPKDNGFVINICQRTEQGRKNVIGQKDLESKSKAIWNYFRESLNIVGWENLYPQSITRDDNTRSISYIKSSPICYFIPIDDVQLTDSLVIQKLMQVIDIYYKLKNDPKVRIILSENYENNDYNLELSTGELIYNNYQLEVKEEALQVRETEYKPNDRTISREKHKMIINSRSEFGDTAEQIVVFHEKDYLNKIGKSDLAEKVEMLTTDGNGFDVLSFNPDGSQKFIEVKSSTKKQNKKLFFTRNEIDKLKTGNIWLYVVHINNSISKLEIIKSKWNSELENNLIPITFELNIQ